ncbi:hypothetical protein SETIT_2G386300v2, partial [Setaria italica]
SAGVAAPPSDGESVRHEGVPGLSPASALMEVAGDERHVAGHQRAAGGCAGMQDRTYRTAAALHRRCRTWRRRTSHNPLTLPAFARSPHPGRRGWRQPRDSDHFPSDVM